MKYRRVAERDKALAHGDLIDGAAWQEEATGRLFWLEAGADDPNEQPVNLVDVDQLGIVKRLFPTALALLLLAGCTSDAEYHARAAMAQADASARTAEANARAAEAMAKSAADTAGAMAWSSVMPGIVLLLAVVILALIGLWFWNQHSRRESAARAARERRAEERAAQERAREWWLMQQVMSLALPAPASPPPAVQIEARRRGLLPVLQDDHWLLVDAAGVPRSRMLPAPIE